jgi:phosphodiesterase/alkaline phosphatase D-like protein
VVLLPGPGRSARSGGAYDPAPGRALRVSPLRFASCQYWEQGYFTAYRPMLDVGLNLLVHLGDDIYESASCGRRGTAPRGAGAHDA